MTGKEQVSDLADEFSLQPRQNQTGANQVLAKAERELERSTARQRVEDAK